MKKMYQQPQTEEMEVRLQDVIQVTAGNFVEKGGDEDPEFFD